MNDNDDKNEKEIETESTFKAILEALACFVLWGCVVIFISMSAFWLTDYIHVAVTNRRDAIIKDPYDCATGVIAGKHKIEKSPGSSALYVEIKLNDDGETIIHSAYDKEYILLKENDIVYVILDPNKHHETSEQIIKVLRNTTARDRYIKEHKGINRKINIL